MCTYLQTISPTSKPEISSKETLNICRGPALPRSAPKIYQEKSQCPSAKPQRSFTTGDETSSDRSKRARSPFILILSMAQSWPSHLAFLGLGYLVSKWGERNFPCSTLEGSGGGTDPSLTSLPRQHKINKRANSITRPSHSALSGTENTTDSKSPVSGATCTNFQYSFCCCHNPLVKSEKAL